MNLRRQRTPQRITALLTFIVLCCASVYGQYSQTLSLGRSTLYSVPTSRASLMENTPLFIGMRSATYVAEVGGVTFESVAVPDFNGRTPVIGLRYMRNNPDGRRLWVSVDNQWVVAPIYDWQLIPIANFGASKYTACFSLFGDPNDLGDARAAQAVREQYGRVVKFHPAFKNTLVGLRLMQLDILIISTDAVDLPKANGHYLLGAGESAPNPAANEIAALNFYRGLVQFNRNGKQGFESYIINDQNAHITFSAQNGTLLLRGSPTYFTFDRDQATGQPLPNRALNQWLAVNISGVRAINAAIWDNAVTTAQYAAFFRYVKLQNPGAWNSFMNQIAFVPLHPSIQTPDVVVDPLEAAEARRDAQRREAARRRIEELFRSAGQPVTSANH